MDLLQELCRFLDGEQRLRAWPSLPKLQGLALEYLASKFETGTSYSREQVNAILNGLHTFDAADMLRRQLYQNGLLDCTADGTEYWKLGP